MPVIIIAAVVGAGVGYVAARGTDDLASIVKWSVVGAGLYIGAKAARII